MVVLVLVFIHASGFNILCIALYKLLKPFLPTLSRESKLDLAAAVLPLQAHICAIELIVYVESVKQMLTVC